MGSFLNPEGFLIWLFLEALQGVKMCQVIPQKGRDAALMFSVFTMEVKAVCVVAVHVFRVAASVCVVRHSLRDTWSVSKWFVTIVTGVV